MIPSVKLTAGDVTLRLMEPGDLPALHAIYRSHVPETPPGEPQVEEALHEASPNYFVVESEARIVGGGGIDLGNTGEQSLLYLACVHPEVQGRGLGSLLVLARLAWTDGDPGMVWAVVPSKVEGFYERFGFEKVAVPGRRETAPGFTRMARWIYAAEREEIQSLLRGLPVRDLTGPGADPCGSEEGGESSSESRL